MTPVPSLDRALVELAGFSSRASVTFPERGLLDLPERAVQFGTGAFLRGFVEYFVDNANRSGMFNGRVVAVSSTGSGRDAKLDSQDGLYTLAVQGIVDGVAVSDYRIVSSLSRSISANTDWDAVLLVAENPDLEVIFSNTTEVGIVLDESDSPALQPPRSFPGKLTAFLYHRAAHFAFDAAKGVTVIPCELIEDNGAQLLEIVRVLSDRWNLDKRFMEWVDDSVTFCNTLVDRIVSGTPAPDRLAEMAKSLGYRDQMLTICEPYRLLAIEGDTDRFNALGLAHGDGGVVLTESVTPYRERKVRLLNGAHTILVPLALLAGHDTVFDAIEDPNIGQFLRAVMLDEIVPSLDVPDAEIFAGQVIERFRNPFIEHSLFGITLHGTKKMAVRVVPSIVESLARTGETPSSLAFGFAAYLLFMRGDLQKRRRERGLDVPPDEAGKRVAALWSQVSEKNTEQIVSLVDAVCADASLWDIDLRSVDGFAGEVAVSLLSLIENGVQAALIHFLGSQAATRRVAI
jgi:tagaturonate reductase